VEAYEVLTNTEKKVQYDYYLAYRDQRIHLSQNYSRVSPGTPTSCTDHGKSSYAAQRRSFDLNDIFASAYRTCYTQSVYRSQFSTPDNMYGTVRITKNHNRTQNMCGTVRFTSSTNNGSDVKPNVLFNDLTM